MHMLKKEHMGIYADGLGEVFDGNGNRQPAEDWIQRHPEIHNEKKKNMAGPFGQNFIAATHNSIQ